MLKIFDAFRDITFSAIALRMLLAAFCSGLIGLERALKNRPAGLRTHILVCIGAAIASLTGHFLYLNLHLPTDMTRIGAQVVSGLGFLGAGTIIVTNRQTIRGLTTAASLWVTGIVGLAIGAGFYEGAIITSVLVFLIQLIFSSAGYSVKYRSAFALAIAYDHKKALDSMVHYCARKGLTIIDIKVSGGENESPRYKATVSIWPSINISAEELIDRLTLSGEYVSVCQIETEAD